MTTELPKTYDPAQVEPRIARKWNDAAAFGADPSASGKPYCIVIPPPNVTAALHMGHALNNTLQDVLIRWRRMTGDNTVWMPGTDHAGIATQTVVDKRLLAEGKPALKDYKQLEAQGKNGREQFIEKVQAWKDEYEQRITDQLKAMGCSCDWARQRFTMDDVCATAVREAFFQLFKDGLIYRGKRLVNWDPATQTALADDEVEMREVDGHFWYLKYPLTEPVTLDGRKVDHVTVATTRPETMLGDTAVAINPKDRRAAALRGKKVRLPIVNREIPIIEDDYVVLPDPDSDDPKARYATGFLKVTPAHDPNDWEIGQRHNLAVINVMGPDGAISDQHGWPQEDFAQADREAVPLGLDRYEAREAIVDWFRRNNLLQEVKPYTHSVGHSYRSHVPIEPYLSDQWYVKVTDDRLAGAALRAMIDEQFEHFNERAAKGRPQGDEWERQLRFHPARYAKTFQSWHENIRDWCISRQLWWGHRIPVWTVTFETAHSYTPGQPATSHLQRCCEDLLGFLVKCGIPEEGIAIREQSEFLSGQFFLCSKDLHTDKALSLLSQICQSRKERDDEKAVADVQNVKSDFKNLFRIDIDQFLPSLSSIAVLQQDPDVLDTWFSSALWPFSVFGWPDPRKFPKEIPEGEAPLEKWNPGNVLCTAREIITLWVSRMVMMNLYLRRCLPFTDVFVHAMIQDGQGRKMSKSLGNGVDPLEIIHSHGTDAMRFTLAVMTTQTQDVRMPVTQDPATGRNTSEKFDLGRNFANKLWNAARFALMNLQVSSDPAAPSPNMELSLPDRWILSRLAATVRDTDAALGQFEFSNYAQGLYDFFWRDLCDWYIEAVKPTIQSNPTQRHVLAACLDVVLRLLHPLMPFITEEIWESLNQTAPYRFEPLADGLEIDPGALLVRAAWPGVSDGLVDSDVESAFSAVQAAVTAIRQVRTTHQVPPKQRVKLSAKLEPDAARRVLDQRGLIEALANVELDRIGPEATRPGDAAVALIPGGEIYLHGLIDPGAERARLSKRLEEVNKNVEALGKRLSNPSYVDKAPPHLVEQTRQQLAAAQEESQAVRQQLTAIDDNTSA